jgi:hypothetical protein
LQGNSNQGGDVLAARMREMTNAYNILVENLEGRDPSKDLGVDG